MKRFAYVLLVVALLTGFVNTRPAAAQGTWNTGIDVQNLTATDGTVTVYFYTSTGADAGNLSDPITAWGSLNYYLPSETVPVAGAAYSAVIQSTVQVAATVSLGNYDLGGADIYLGTDNPESALTFPLVYRNYTSKLWNSEITVQNASDAAQNVTLKLYNHGSTTAAYTSAVTNIPAYASKTFNIVDAAYAAFVDFGSATVTGSAPLAGTAKNVRNPGTGAVNVLAATYRAFGTTQKGMSIVAPLVYKNYNLWTTGVNIANVGGAATTVTITYTNANPAVAGGPWTDTLPLAAGAMGLFYTPGNTTGLPDNFYGSATMSSSASDIVVVVASQRYRTDGAQGVNYEGSKASDATACVSLPVVHNRTSWKTGINILNMGATASNITIAYHSSASGIPNASKNYTIPAHSPLTVYMPTDAATAVGFYGAADIKSTNGQPLLVNAAHSYATKGVASNFVGINYTCP
jgi:hypothetical protein